MKKPFTIDKSQLSYILDLDERTLTAYQNKEDDPLPIEKKGRRGQANIYNPQEIIKWFVRFQISKQMPDGTDRIVDLDAARARLATVQADGHVLKNKVQEGLLVPVELLESTLADVFGQVNSILESIPMKIKNRVPSLSASDIHVIKKEIVKAQNAASEVTPPYEAIVSDT